LEKCCKGEEIIKQVMTKFVEVLNGMEIIYNDSSAGME